MEKTAVVDGYVPLFTFTILTKLCAYSGEKVLYGYLEFNCVKGAVDFEFTCLFI